jgi:manganese oxidase
LNGSVSRIFKIAIVDAAGNKLKYHMIGNDGNLMEYAIPFPNTESKEALPQQGIAERLDIIVDFNQSIAGNTVYFVNTQEHQNGKGPSNVIPLANILNGSYKADYKNGDPAVGKFLELRVKGCGTDGLQACTDLSMKPSDYEPGKKNLIVRRKFTTAELQTAKHRTFEFARIVTTDNKPWAIKTDGGVGLNADMSRVSAAFRPTDAANPQNGSVEIWHIKSAAGWLHPVHVHFEEGQILYRDGKTPPIWEKYARKDMYRVGGPGPLPDLSQQVDMAIRVREFAGTYVEHCHNTQHEDHAMLLRWDSMHPGQTIPIPSPELGWEGVTYVPTATLPTYLTGDPNAAKKFVIPPQ